jgi:hypothetical protein
MLYAPDGSHPWLLRDKASGKEFGLKGVYNIRHNGKLVENHIETGVFNLYSDDSDKMIVTCEVHFDPIPANVKVADLIEGKGTDSYSNHFHVLNIKMKAPRAAVTPAVEEVAIIEEVIETIEAKPAVNKATVLVDVPGIECNVFPNPATELVNVKLTDIDKARMQLMNANGQVLWSAVTQDPTTTINVAEYPAGTYFLHVTVGTQTAVKAVVVE